jgi:Fe-S-cluster containining protein
MWISLIVLAVALLVCLVVIVALWLNVAMSSDRDLAGGSETAGRLRPRFSRGGDLLNWATRTAAWIVRRRLTQNHSQSTPMKLAAELEEGATRAMFPLAPEREMRRIMACPDNGQGTIGITVPEVLGMAHYIRHNMSRAERKRIYDLAVENTKRIAELDQADISADQIPCPLQGEDKICRAYSARPLRCRALHTATIAEQLGLKPAAGEDEAPALVAAEVVERGFEEGLTLGLRSAGLDANQYELNSALVRAMDVPDAPQRWMRGEDVFAGCRLYS